MIYLYINDRGELFADDTFLASRGLNAEDLKRATAFFAARPTAGLGCSSSIDFPEDFGGPDVRHLDKFLMKATTGYSFGSR